MEIEFLCHLVESFPCHLVTWSPVYIGAEVPVSFSAHRILLYIHSNLRSLLQMMVIRAVTETSDDEKDVTLCIVFLIGSF